MGLSENVRTIAVSAAKNCIAKCGRITEQNDLIDGIQFYLQQFYCDK